MASLSHRFAIGDRVKPKTEWIGDPNEVPSGCVRAIAPWGDGGAFYVDGDHRAFAAYVFEAAE
jgi:hypothetical protein